MSTHRAPARLPRQKLRGRRFVILASQFNRPITGSLVKAAIRLLKQAGALPSQIRVFWVPGAFELPNAAARVAVLRPRPDAILALGALIKGETPQYQVIAQACAQGLAQVSVASRIPVAFGVIMAQTPAQARARAGGRRGNRGEEAAAAALSMLELFNR